MKNDDLVTLAEAQRALGMRSRSLSQMDQRARDGYRSDLPAPAVEGRSVRLWSLAELTRWWNAREVDARGHRIVRSTPNNT